MTMKQETILVVNGPNLGVLGKRQPEIYGRESLEDLPRLLHNFLGKEAENIYLDIFQSNSEGELIDELEMATQKHCQGVISGFGLTSYILAIIALLHSSLSK